MTNPMTDPTLTAADLCIVAARLHDLRRLVAQAGTTPPSKAQALDALALETAAAVVVALAVDCDASVSAARYIDHAETAARLARLFAQHRDA